MMEAAEADPAATAGAANAELSTETSIAQAAGVVGDETEPIVEADDTAEDGADPTGERAAAKFGIGADQLEGMRNVFNTFDLDKDGIVMAEEIGELLRSLNLVQSRKMLRCIVDIVDIDGDGRIDFGEFVSLMARVKTEADRGAGTSVEEGDDTFTDESFGRPKSAFTLEEEAKQKFRQESLATFQRAVTIMAFQQMTGDAAAMREAVTKILRSPPDERTEWELQRFLMWVESFDFIQQLPPSSESDVRIEVCRCMSYRKLKAGGELCRQGDKGDCMYVILSGEVDIWEELNSNSERKWLASQGEGTSFGELAIMGDEAERYRTATVTCKTECSFGILQRVDYRRFILRMRQEEKAEVVLMMHKHPCLARVGKSELLKMAMMSKPVKFNTGERFVQQGQAPDRIIFLTSGSCELVLDPAQSLTDGKQKTPRRKHVPSKRELTDESIPFRTGSEAYKLLENAAITTAPRGKQYGEVQVAHLEVGSAVEIVGAHILTDDADEHLVSYLATGAEGASGFAVRCNVFKKVLGKSSRVRHLVSEQRKLTQAFIQQRHRENAASVLTRSKLGFEPVSPTKNVQQHKIFEAMKGTMRHVGVREILDPPNYRAVNSFIPIDEDIVEATAKATRQESLFALKWPRRTNLASPRSRNIGLRVPPEMSTSVVAFGSSLRTPGTSAHENEPLLWRLPGKGPIKVRSELQDARAARSGQTVQRATETTVRSIDGTPVQGRPTSNVGLNYQRSKPGVVVPRPPRQFLGGTRGRIALAGGPSARSLQGSTGKLTTPRQTAGVSRSAVAGDTQPASSTQISAQCAKPSQRQIISDRTTTQRGTLTGLSDPAMPVSTHGPASARAAA